MTHHNNPPAHLVVVDDAGSQTGLFVVGAAARA